MGRDYEKINEYAKIFYQKFILLCQCLNSIISQGSCFGKNKEFFNLLKEVAQEKKIVHLKKSKWIFWYRHCTHKTFSIVKTGVARQASFIFKQKLLFLLFLNLW